MLVAESGIVISVSPVHLANANSPMLTIELGAVTDVMPVQSLKALDAIPFISSSKAKLPVGWLPLYPMHDLPK